MGLNNSRKPNLLRRLGLPSMEERDLFGFSVLPVNMAQAVEICERAIEKRVPVITGQLSGTMVTRIHQDGQLRRSVAAAEFVMGEGAGVVFASHLLGRPLPERIGGPDLMLQLMERADARGYRVYLLGAEQWVVDEVVARFSREYPGAKIVGHRNGYFSQDDEESIVDTIRASEADILFVGITTPIKENFLARWRDALGVPVLHGVGGSFDVVAGKVKRAPLWVQHVGLEWAYRIVQEPRRMWRREGLSVVFFCGLVAWEMGAKVLKIDH